MSRCHYFFFLIIAIVASPAQANQSLTSVFQDALEHYELTGSAGYDLQSSGALAKQARALTGPQIRLSLESGINNNQVNDLDAGIATDLDLNQTEATASLSQPLFDRELKHLADAANTDEATAKVRLELEKQTLAESTALAYLEVQLQNELFLLSRAKYQRLSKELQRVQKLVQQGFTANIDVSGVMLEIERAKLEIHEGHRNVGIAKAQLYQLTGKMHTPPTQAKRFQDVGAEQFRMPELSGLMQAAEKNNLNLYIAQLQQEAASQRYRSARASVYPKLSLDGEYSTKRLRNDLETDTDDLSIGLRLRQDFSLLGNANSLGARSSRYLSLSEKQRSNRLQHQVRAQLNRLHSEYQGGIQSFFTLRNMLARSEKKIQLVQRAVPLGKRFQRDVYDAIVESYSIRAALAARFYALLRNQTSIRYQSGTLNETVLQDIDKTLLTAS